ncbi:MAG TPA: glycosyltransferase [Vicinamibacterales bacterium]|nr:glycosyltransferase [Vicinamibacterales bacterium]
MSGASRPLVSILMNSRDPEPGHLAAAVRSVLWQTWPSLELIVSEASDGTSAARILSAFRDPRLTVVRDRDRRGWAHGANLAFAHARGDFIAFAACDDIFHPRALEAMVGALEATGAGAAVVPVRGIDGAGVPLGKALSVPAHVRAEPTWVRLFERNYIIFALGRRRALPSPLVDESVLGVGGDWDVWLRLVRSSARFVYHDEPLFDYRVHDQSLVARQADTRRDMRAILARYPLDEIAALYRRAGIDPTVTERALAAIDILFGRYQDALARWLRTPASTVDRRDWCFQVGTLQLLLGRATEARGLLEEAVTCDATGPDAWNNLGVCHERLGQTAARQDCLRKALALFPLYQDARRNLETGAGLITERPLRPVVEIFR